jgi:seryl-tRNA synthetase
MKGEILNSIQELYDELKRHREKAVVLQRELDSLVATNNQQNESIALFRNVIQEKTIKIEGLVKNVDSLKKHVTRLENKQEELTNNISDLKSEIYVKENEASVKELEIKDLRQKMNTIFYIIGNSKELREKKIIVKKGVSLFSSNYVLGENFNLAEFKQGKSSLTEFEIDGKVKSILPYRNKDHYHMSYENGVTYIIVKDPKNFWHQKYLVIVTS